MIPWREFFVGVKRTSLAPDEIITAVVVPDDVPDRQEFANQLDRWLTAAKD